jgi:hypothetical protein
VICPEADDAPLAAGSPDDMARKTAEAVAGSENQFAPRLISVWQKWKAISTSARPR